MNPTNAKWDGDAWVQTINGVTRRIKPAADGVHRTWHANGTLATEHERVNGQIVGTLREWHDNGVLAKEIPFANGKANGTVRQWNRDGKLLGEYTMVNGRGVERTWNEDGSLQQEYEQIFSTPELIASRGIVYDDLGKGHEVYLWNGRRISKKKFLERVAKEQGGNFG